MKNKELDDLINERLEVFIEKSNNINEIVSLSTAFTTAMLANMVVSLYSSYLSKMSRYCRNYTGSAKTVCNLNFKIKGLQAAISKAKQVKSKCKDTKNEAKCIERMDKKIENMMERIKVYVQQLNELKSYSLK